MKGSTAEEFGGLLTDEFERWNALKRLLGPRLGSISPRFNQGPIRKSISMCVVFDKLREPLIGFLLRALKRLEINVDHAEATAVAFRPLKIIEQ